MGLWKENGQSISQFGGSDDEYRVQHFSFLNSLLKWAMNLEILIGAIFPLRACRTLLLNMCVPVPLFFMPLLPA